MTIQRLWWAWFLGVCLCFVSTAHAQSLPTTAVHDPGLIITRCEIAEEGYTYSDGHAAVLLVLFHRATRNHPEIITDLHGRNVRTAQLALRYCSALKAHAPPRSNRWGWAARRARWPWLQAHVDNRILKLVRNWIDGVVDLADIDPCDRPVIQWGSRHDCRVRGWPIREAVHCGNARDYFFATEVPNHRLRTHR